MTDINQPPLATGGMSTAGTTTVVKINQPQLDPVDKKVICSAICYCKDTPGVGKDGRSLKQSCVSSRLAELDVVLKHRSPYKPEINYDMTKSPPAPIMDSGIDTKGHDWLAGWIKKYWDLPDENGNTRPPFEAGSGQIRRPDVVIVSDPTKPPTQDNIKRVVEIKFPPDVMSDPQRAAYEKVGGKGKLVEMGPDKCDCDNPDSRSTIPVKEIGGAAALTAALYLLLTRRPPPGLNPAY
jgi:hypothetical protein